MTAGPEEKKHGTNFNPGSAYNWAPVFVVLLGAAATALATYSVRITSSSRDQIRLTMLVQTTTNLIQERLEIYDSVLRGGSALFAAVENLNPEDFRSYARRLDLRETYPGIQGFGFAKRVIETEKSAFIEEIRNQGQTAFTIRPEGERAEYYPITFIEPLDRRNQAALGYDMFAEPVRQEAMARARDGGDPVASAKVELVQEIDTQKQPGFLLYAPVYHGGLVPENLTERREKILGFVYSPFRAQDLFEGIFPQHPAEISFQVYDGPVVVPPALLYQSEPGRNEDRSSLSRTVPFTFAGHQWTIQFRTNAEFAAGSHRTLIPWVLLTGLLLSFIFYAITAALVRAHSRLRLAEAALQNHIDRLEETVAARTSRLRETIFELEHISYSMVHDMRAPLRAIHNFAVMLEEDAGAALTPECRDYISRMRNAASRMDSLIRDVLNYAKLVEQELPLYPVEVPPLVRGIVDTYPNLHPNHADIEIDSEIPAVLANEAALTQCFSNLLSNAVKFSKPGIKPKISIKGERVDGLVQLIIRDNGVGIPKALQQKVFTVFQRLNTTKDGTGIGLAIVRKAVERMGGTISLESREGIGTCFILQLKSPPDREEESRSWSS